MSKKEQQQVIILGLLIVVIVGVAGYMNRDKFMPAVPDGPSYSRIPRQQIPSAASLEALIERADFRRLQAFGDVPVSPGSIGTPDLFSPFEE